MNTSAYNKILNQHMLVCFLLGISSGLPLLAIGGTLQAWLKDSNASIENIGLLTLTGLPYTLKFLWAPLIDYYNPLKLGRRKSWMLITQIALVILFTALSFSNPVLSLSSIALLALLIAVSSATQDIVLDAYRRDILLDQELGLGSSLFVNGYRVGMIISGALALILADHYSWQMAYLMIATSFLIGIITTIFSREPKSTEKPLDLKSAIINPLRDFFNTKDAILLLIFILLFKVGDSMASAMTTPYILSMGFTKTDYAIIAKSLGMGATIAGGLFAGLLMFKISMNKALWIFGSLQAISTLFFVLLIFNQGNKNILALIITFEFLAGGAGATALTAFMSSLTNRAFSATQFALLSSLLGVPRVIFGAYTGYLVAYFGWAYFFIFCTAIALPGIFLLLRIAPWMGSRSVDFSGHFKHAD